MTGDDAEKAALHEFLTWQRSSVRAILAGLDDSALRAPVLRSGWTPLGMVEPRLGPRPWFSTSTRARTSLSC